MALLIKVQSRAVPLSQCIAEALAIADACGAAELATFCTNELVGYPVAEDETEALARTHRHMQMYCTAGRLNLTALSYRGIGIFDYINANPELFIDKTHVENQPIATIEARPLPTNPNGSWTLESSVRQFNPSAEDDSPITCYSRPDGYQRIIEAVRAKLTKLLTELAPIKSSSGVLERGA
jgi:hypothetical protein